MTFRTFFSVFIYAFLAIASRFLPHWPNFTGMNAMALMSGFALGSPFLSFSCVCIVNIATDWFFGFYQGMPFVYLSYGLIALIGSQMKKSNRWSHRIFFTFAASLLFFLLSNFGAWLYNGLYTTSWEGLIHCYIAALPFFANQLLGDLCFSAGMFGISLVINRKMSYNSFPLHR